MGVFIIAVSVFGGSILAGVIAFLKSQEAFNAKKFLLSVLSGIGGAITFALAYNFSGAGITVYDVLAAVLAGMGVTGAVSGGIGTVRSIKARKAVKS